MRNLGPGSAILFGPLAVLAACAPVPQNESEAALASDGAILVSARPANGATIRAPQGLALTFRQPVRLAELTISGPSGEMPIMVTSAGLRTAYSLPLPDLEPGPYHVTWRALAQDGTTHAGRLSFTVR